jgi:V/A-type H+-transporting ATPase subunit I
MIVKMTKIHLYGPKELMGEVTSALHETGVLHLEQLPPGLTSLASVRDRIAEERDDIHEKLELESILDKLQAIITLLPRPEGAPAKTDQRFAALNLPAAEQSAVIAEIHQKVEAAAARKKDLTDRADLLRKYEKMMKTLMPVVDAIPDSQHLDMIGLTIDKRNEAVIPMLEKEMARLTGGNFHIFSSEIEPGTIATVIAFGKSHSPRVRELLWEQNLSEMRLPSSLQDLPFKDALGAIHAQSENLPGDIKAVEAELTLLSRQHYHTLVELRDSIAGRIQQMSTSAGFFKTHYSFVVAGWLPKKSLEPLKERLTRDFGGKVVVEEVPLSDEDHKKIPIHMVNHPFIRPFEVFVKLLPLPIYNTVDPTPFFAFFFPLFFGLISGDIGYGLIFMTIALLLRRKLTPGTKMHDISTVLAISSVYTILFGILFMEFLGTVGEHYFGWHPLNIGGQALDRLNNVNLFLGISLIVGCIHVFLGILLGMVNAVRGGHRKHLIFKIGQFVSLLSLVALVALSLAGMLDKSLMWPVGLILAAGVVTVTVTEGFIAPIELLSAMGNILSYARLMAVGLSGVILAKVANDLGRESSNVFVGVIIALLIHSLNIALGIFSPVIHSMRLHLVEFFTKFYESGGVEYKPFKRGGK